MTERSWTIRLAAEQDGGFLADMLVEAVNWSPTWSQSRESIFADPRITHYISGWPRPRDLGVVAEAGGEPVGASWLRFMPADDPGFGFVAPDVPELSIGVRADWRGRGVGRSLLRAVADAGRQRGIRRISLSVQRENFARQLYLSEGYEVADASNRHSDTMVRLLAQSWS